MNNQNPLENLSDEEIEKLRKDFEKKIFKDLNLEDLPEDKKTEFLEKLSDHINNTLINVIIENLSEEQLEQAEEEIKKSDRPKEEIFIEMAKSIPGLGEKINKALDDLYGVMLKASKNFREKGR